MLVFIKSWFGVPNMRYYAWEICDAKDCLDFPREEIGGRVVLHSVVVQDGYTEGTNPRKQH